MQSVHTNAVRPFESGGNGPVADLDREVLKNSIAYSETGKPNTPVNRPRALL